MIYDIKRNKGVRRKCLPEPNPVRTTFSKDATINDIAKKAIELFYQDFSPVSECDVLLADSSGNQIILDNPVEFKIGKYYLSNHLAPSRHKFYTMLKVLIFIKIRVLNNYFL